MNRSTLPTHSVFRGKLWPAFVFLFSLVSAQVLLCAQVSADAPAAALAVPKPQLVVSLMRPNIEENATLPVTVVFSNDSDTDLSEVALRLDSTDQLKWQLGLCSDKNPKGVADNKVSMGYVRAHAVIYEPLCLQSPSAVVMGTVNLLFTVDFKWNANCKSGNSFVSVEKPLTVQLLGADNLAGVPLGIAGLVVPGLLFGIVVTAFGAKWGPGIALGDKLIYSVLISAAILAALSPISFLSLRTGLSLEKLAWWAGIGAVLGAVAGGIDWWLRDARQATVDARTVRFGDDEISALGKLLHLHDGKSVRKTTVRTKTGGLYLGSYGEQRNDLVTLIGWFQLDIAGKEVADVNSLRTLLAAKKYAEAFDAAKQRRFTIKPVDAIRQPSAEGQEITTGDSVRYWKPEDVEEMVPAIGEFADNDKPPLSCP